MDKKKVLWWSLAGVALLAVGVIAIKKFQKTSPVKSADDKKEADDKKTTDDKPATQEVAIPLPFLNSFQGNKFRGWMKQNHSDFKDSKNEPLDETGAKFNNRTIKEAWERYGLEYIAQKTKGFNDVKAGSTNSKEARRIGLQNYLEDTKKQPLDLSKAGSFKWNPSKNVTVTIFDNGQINFKSAKGEATGYYATDSAKNELALALYCVKHPTGPYIFVFSLSNDDAYNGLTSIIKSFTNETVSFAGFSHDGGISNGAESVLDSQSSIM